MQTSQISFVLWGGSTEAIARRQTYAEAVGADFNSIEGHYLSWDVVADLLKRVAFRIAGSVPARDHRPWFRGTEKELKSLARLSYVGSSQSWRSRGKRFA